MNRQTIIIRLQEKKTELQQLGIEHLRLFGSSARNEARADSDIDLAATFSPSAHIGFGFVSIAKRLEELLGTPIDLISYPPTNKHIHTTIEREGLDVF